MIAELQLSPKSWTTRQETRLNLRVPVTVVHAVEAAHDAELQRNRRFCVGEAPGYQPDSAEATLQGA